MDRPKNIFPALRLLEQLQEYDPDALSVITGKYKARIQTNHLFEASDKDIDLLKDKSIEAQNLWLAIREYMDEEELEIVYENPDISSSQPENMP